MAKVLVIHPDQSERDFLESLARPAHEVQGAKDLISGLKKVAASKPDVIIISHEPPRHDGLTLLRYMRENVMKIPVVILSRKLGTSQAALKNLGVKSFLEYPVEKDRFDAAIAAAVEARKSIDAAPPPITAEENRISLSVLESQLNKKMKCFAGKNKVHLQSIILGGRTSKPRIALKCGLRGEYGLNKNVYYEFIRDTCCGDPTQCEAIQRFNADRDA